MIAPTIWPVLHPEHAAGVEGQMAAVLAEVLGVESVPLDGHVREEVPPNARWGGNPAREMRELPPDLPVRRISTHDTGAMLVRAE